MLLRRHDLFPAETRLNNGKKQICNEWKTYGRGHEVNVLMANTVGANEAVISMEALELLLLSMSAW